MAIKPIPGSIRSLLTRALDGAREAAIARAEGERALMLAILADATACYDGLQGRKARREAIAWFASNTSSPGSFVWVCSYTGADPDMVRRLLS